MLIAGSVRRPGRIRENNIITAHLMIWTLTTSPNPADSLSESWNLLRKGVQEGPSEPQVHFFAFLDFKNENKLTPFGDTFHQELDKKRNVKVMSMSICF